MLLLTIQVVIISGYEVKKGLKESIFPFPKASENNNLCGKNENNNLCDKNFMEQNF